MRPPARFAALVALALACVAGSASAGPKAGAHGQAAKAAGRSGQARAGKGPAPRSIGAPNDGKLVGAARLKGSRHLEPRQGSHSWGLPALTAILKRAADDVASRHKGSVLLVGDLSARGGGPLTGHKSHQSGRDADVGFFVANSKGKPVRVHRFMAFDGEGKARTGPAWARFDDARNWSLVEALFKEDHREGVAVHFLFVSTDLKARLLRYAAKKGAHKDLIERAAAAMLSPDHVDVHDDHFHVRLSCPQGMQGCIEESAPRSSAAAEAAPPADAPQAAVEHGKEPATTPAP
jgi:penicillin-insensitive murein endopeptidase